MPTLRSGKVWQVIRHFGVLFFCNLGTPKTVFSKLVTTRQIETPYFPHVNMTKPTMFPGDKKASIMKKSLGQNCINSFLALHVISRSLVFFGGGALTVGPLVCCT